MKKILNITKSLLDKIFFTCGLLLGSQIPNFIKQYHQRIGGRLDQATEDLEQFQKIANNFHNGSLEELIKKHLSSKDTTFHHEGFIIKDLVEKTNYLLETYNSLNTNLHNQIKYLIFNLDRDIVSATWSIYKPGITLTTEAILCALIIGFVFSAVFQLALYLVTKTMSSTVNKQ